MTSRNNNAICGLTLPFFIPYPQITASVAQPIAAIRENKTPCDTFIFSFFSGEYPIQTIPATHISRPIHPRSCTFSFKINMARIEPNKG